jgi:hypothetical protein
MVNKKLMSSFEAESIIARGAQTKERNRNQTTANKVEGFNLTTQTDNKES